MLQNFHGIPFISSSHYNLHKTISLPDSFKFIKRLSTHDIYASQKATEEKLLGNISGCSTKLGLVTESRRLENGLAFKRLKL